MKGINGILNKNKQTDTADEEDQALTDNMDITDLSDKLNNDVAIIYESMLSYSNIPPVEDYVSSSLSEIRESVNSAIFKDLTNVARLIDNGSSSVKSLQNDLESSKSDLMNSAHVKTVPTPFIIRTIEDLENRKENLRHGLALQSSKMQINTCNENFDVSLAEMLKQQNQALVRLSGKCAKIRAKYEALNSEIRHKLPHSFIRRIDTYEEFANMSGCVDGIISKYQEFKSSKKARMEKIISQFDLFGSMANATGNSTTVKRSIFGGGLQGKATLNQTAKASQLKPPDAPKSDAKSPFH